MSGIAIALGVILGLIFIGGIIATICIDVLFMHNQWIRKPTLVYKKLNHDQLDIYHIRNVKVIEAHQEGADEDDL